MKKIILSLFAIVALTTQNVNAEDVPLISLSQEEFIEFSKQPDTVVIDVRTSWEYGWGHVPGAINMPHRSIVSGKLNFDDFTDKNLVFYCRTGVRVAIVNEYLNKNPSFPREQLFHLKGDYNEWKARGREIAKP